MLPDEVVVTALVGLLTSAVTAIGLAALGTRSATWARTAGNRHDTGDARMSQVSWNLGGDPG